MKLEVFSVYDSKAQAYLPPFFLPKPAMAIRIFTECVNSPEHQFGKHPADYTLFHVGSFDDTDGDIISIDPQKNLGNGLHLLTPNSEQELEHAFPNNVKRISAGGTTNE